jgi:hypothetical protein
LCWLNILREIHQVCNNFLLVHTRKRCICFDNWLNEKEVPRPDFMQVMDSPDTDRTPAKARRVDFVCEDRHIKLLRDLVRAYGFVSSAELIRRLLEREAREPRLNTETPLAEVHQILRLLGHNQRKVNGEK